MRIVSAACDYTHCSFLQQLRKIPIIQGILSDKEISKADNPYFAITAAVKFQSHLQNKTGVIIRKRSKSGEIIAKIDTFRACVTLKFDG